MHQALYRKWRPRTFDEVCGQDHITSILKYEVANSKFSHAYLFCGSRGTGKTSCAKILAKAVNCLSPENGNPCGKCAACLSIDSGAATDVLEMDAASNNGVDNIRDIRDEVVYSPSNLKYRVYIIDEVHMLSQSAFNALLKTLEEPPEHVVFILATTELHKLPATIISRCQRFDFRRITTEILRNHLLDIAKAEKIEITESAATILAKHAQGGMRDAISLLDLCAGSRRLIDDALVSETVGLGGREKLIDVVRAIAKKDYEKIFEAVDETVRSSRDIAVFWQELISVYRDLLIVKNSKEPQRYLDLTDSETEELVGVAKLFSAELLTYHTEILSDALLTMTRANAVRRIVAELTLIRMCDAKLSTSQSSMLARISALESAIASGVKAASTAPGANAEERPARRARAAKPADDDDVFKEDAPRAVGRSVAPATQKPAASSQTNGGAVRTLKPFKKRAEAIEIMCRRDPMTAPFYKSAKWYADESGSIVLKFGSKDSLDRAKMFGGDASFVAAVSQVLGTQFTPSQVKFECEAEQKSGGLIDRIIEAAEDN
ncbi:MAG: DNA polymerase III subunit gamma/tau [Clostridia bacterium]|nr:DNA polymerase III subunit gamma/tau [Clostridia bacterium]